MSINRCALNEVSSILSGVNKFAYNNKYLLSNQILSKNVGNIYSDSKWENKEKSFIVLLKVPLYLLWYYLKSFGGLFMFLLEWVAYKISGYSVNLDTIQKKSVLVDVFVNVEHYEKNGVFYDKYFHGLYDVLTELGIKYYLIPKFYNKKYNILSVYGMFRFFRERSVLVISNYQLTTFRDILDTLAFILVYPISVIKTFVAWQADSSISKALRYELLFDINKVTFYSFQQYLYGKHISSLNVSKIISWFENQTMDKNLYLGLRARNPDVYIYGCQLYIYSSNQLSIKVDPSEAVFGIIPDKTLVNGRHYLIDNKTIYSATGPSFRYSKIFNEKYFIGGANKKKVLVLLPYYHREIVNIIYLINKLVGSGLSLYIKFHPATSILEYKQLLSSGIVITEDDLYDLFKTTKIVIGAATGSMVEAACCYIPSIVIKNIDGIPFNYFDEYGRGEIWDYAENVDEVMMLLNKYSNSLVQYIGREQIMKCARYYRDNYFCEPTKAMIINSFDLRSV